MAVVGAVRLVSPLRHLLTRVLRPLSRAPRHLSPAKTLPGGPGSALAGGRPLWLTSELSPNLTPNP